MDVEFCLHSCAKTDVKQGSGTKLNLCVRATASQIPYTHNLEFYVHGSCWKSVFVAANHSKIDIQANYQNLQLTRESIARPKMPACS